jgi:hypothetical protein
MAMFDEDYGEFCVAVFSADLIIPQSGGKSSDIYIIYQKVMLVGGEDADTSGRRTGGVMDGGRTQNDLSGIPEPKDLNSCVRVDLGGGRGIMGYTPTDARPSGLHP